MTWTGSPPTSSNRADWTSYERTNSHVGSDLDALSDYAHPLIPDYVVDWEDVTILHGLELDE